jgi:hypothetical protein
MPRAHVTCQFFKPFKAILLGHNLTEECQRFCRKVRFLGKIQNLGVRNSMIYRVPNSRKSNFATEPDLLLSVRTPWVTTTNFIGLLLIPRFRVYLGTSTPWFGEDSTPEMRKRGACAS